VGGILPVFPCGVPVASPVTPEILLKALIFLGFALGIWPLVRPNGRSSPSPADLKPVFFYRRSYLKQQLRNVFRIIACD
jgi:hypothetical protein